MRLRTSEERLLSFSHVHILCVLYCVTDRDIAPHASRDAICDVMTLAALCHRLDQRHDDRVAEGERTPTSTTVLFAE